MIRLDPRRTRASTGDAAGASDPGLTRAFALVLLAVAGAGTCALQLVRASDPARLAGPRTEALPQESAPELDLTPRSLTCVPRAADPAG